MKHPGGVPATYDPSDELEINQKPTAWPNRWGVSAWPRYLVPQLPRSSAASLLTPRLTAAAGRTKRALRKALYTKEVHTDLLIL